MASSGHSHSAAPFPRETDGLPEATAPQVVELADGDRYELVIAPVRKRVGETTVRMLAYNGSVPGPTLVIPEGATVNVDVENRGDMEATVHWHGLRLENRYDGTHDTQAPIPVGERFSYRVHVPDPGVYWYHPHIREDYGQELGLYGNLLVSPAGAEYWAPANRELLLTLDDLLVEDGRIASFSTSETSHVAMGRFGNVMLVGGEPEPEFTAQRGEVVRLFLTNTANTRVFNVAVPRARMKLVGGDSGRVEREVFVEEVLLAPSERVVLDVLFPERGRVTMEHRTPQHTYPLAAIDVADDPPAESFAEDFDVLRDSAELAAERERVEPFVTAEPDRTLAFVAEMDLGGSEASAYTCPMHPEVVSEEPGRCPHCGMKLLPVGLSAPAHDHGGHDHDHGGHDHEPGGHDHDHGGHEHGDSGHHGDGHEHGPGGIEWEDDMLEINRMTTPANMRWKIVDRSTGAENAAIDWRLRVGDRVKIRLVNELDSDHPMPHPFHVHGAGRFLVLARDGVAERNLVWKDTVLVRTGETVDILLDITNPGRWMAHCHIAEHHEAGMMFAFDVEP